MVGARRKASVAHVVVVVLLAAAMLLGSPPTARAEVWNVDNLSVTPFRGPRDAVAWDVVVQPDGLQIEVGEYGDDAVVFGYSPSLGRPTGLDGEGSVILDAGGVEVAYGVALQPDGSIVVAGQASGDIAVWRLRSDGTVDDTFGNDGLARLDMGTDDDAASAVVVADDGGIVVAGRSGPNLALAGFTTAGVPDLTFGTAGTVKKDLGTEAWAESLVRTASGELVVAGGHGDDTLVARFSAAGRPDPTFGPSGLRTVDIGDADTARDVTVDAAGRIVLAGVSGPNAYVARLLGNGLADPLLAGDGAVVTPLRGTPAEANGVVVQADGRIVVVGRTGDDAAIAAFDTTGLPASDFRDGNVAYSSVLGSFDAVLYGLAEAPDGTLATGGWNAAADYPAVLQPLAGRFSSDGGVVGFGRQGIRIERDEPVADLVVQPDDRQVSVATSAGRMAVARHLPGGDVDPSFGGDGTVVLPRPPDRDPDAARAVILQSDGKILVAGMVGCAPGVVRLLPDGSVDPTFGTWGWARAVVDPGRCRAAEDVAVTPDGAIVVGVDLPGGPGVVRFAPGGSLDTAWAAGGIASLPSAIGPVPTSVAAAADGSLVVGGAYALAVARLTATGDVDLSFGNSGVAKAEGPGLSRPSVNEVAVRPDGRIVAVGGTSTSGTDAGFSIARWMPSGGADPTFGGGKGWVATPIPGSGTNLPRGSARGLALLANGRAVAAGDNGSDWVFLRYLDDGSLDPSFGDGGSLTFDVDGSMQTPRAVAPLRDGTLVALGSVTFGRFQHPALAHLVAAPLPPPTSTTSTTTMPTTTTTTIRTSTPTTTFAAPPPSSPPAAVRDGYWMLTSGGAVSAFGAAIGLGNAPTANAVDIESTPSGSGYWIVNIAGIVHAFGDARSHGGAPALSAGETVTSMSRSLSGNGYWLFTTKGRVLAYGDAVFRGDMSQVRLNGPVLDSIPTLSGNGYYMVASDGGIFAFGDARFSGSMGAARLNAPVQSLVPDADGTGYWLVASDGGIFAFDAPFFGSMGAARLNRPVTGMVGARAGYLMVAEDGGIFAFGAAPFRGSLGGNPPLQPVVAVAVVP